MNTTNKKTILQKVVQLLLVALFVIGIGIILFSANGKPSLAATDDNPQATQADARFDMTVRADFFSGFAGDREAFNRAMKVCDETLAKNPKHAEALVWHGSGLLFTSGDAFRAGKVSEGMETWQRGLNEMDTAVALQPDNIGVLIPRAATLLETSKFIRQKEVADKLLQKAVDDYEKVLRLQAPIYNKIGTHARGELLMGIALGWNRLGNQQKAFAYLERITNDLSGSNYAQQAQSWLENKALPATRTCTGCHAN